MECTLRTSVGLIVVCGLLVWLPSCHQRGSTIQPPSIIVDKVAAAAIEAYDANRDGTLDAHELGSAPSIVFALEELDADGSKTVDLNELCTTLRAWANPGIGLTSVVCQVTMDGKPLADAEIIFEPEPFYEGALSSAVGITDRHGSARMVADVAKQQGLPDGMQLGFYKVRISKTKNGEQLVPSRYNEHTDLGRAISRDDRRNSMVFTLSL